MKKCVVNASKLTKLSAELAIANAAIQSALEWLCKPDSDHRMHAEHIQRSLQRLHKAAALLHEELANTIDRLIDEG